ncbi:hypothetical protein AND_000331 [Anopheles darlingi]|uniref:Chitin-binding type-4 domain-containing protein n=3 Tax=Nyssorhynchus TaxID=44543 RepID=W5JWX1_ANODA|nr:uncharacterized protein LOC125954295 isoform X2 [Anopheles darlingi]XP_049540443.1 uncharacterized protein LOC125954295 isoform X2 [Anopheles darlingi]ETN67840.1 hypothetical protein AND_000331 [Anopheles darlingi]
MLINAWRPLITLWCSSATNIALFVVLILVLINGVPRPVSGHGRLMDPPARNAMWRFGYPNPVNYNDNELFCGGYAVQWEQNGGKCGTCGDAYNLRTPRPHEMGGEYGKGIISRRYLAGQVIDVEIELTANHMGHFEIYLCPKQNHRGDAPQSCFDRYPLYLAGTREVRFPIPPESGKKDVFRYRVQLPNQVTCASCTMLWIYLTGNMWGKCSNGTEGVGCGRPETFRNCADISIVSNTGGGRPPLFVGSNNPFLLYYKDYRDPKPDNVYPLIIRDQVCVPTEAYRSFIGMEDWCQSNCLRYPPNCPESVCYCPQTCEAIGEIEGQEGADVYCLDQCLNYRSSCPANKCRCY